MNGHGQGYDWNDVNTTQLKALYAEGLSGSRIAAEMGGGLTRNAVISKVHRIGLEKRGRAPARIPRERTQRRNPFKPKPVAERSRQNAEAGIEADALTDLPSENIIPLGQRCSLLELTDENCHWPIGEPGETDFFFCGGKASEGLPYCGYHCRVAYQPPAARRDRRPTHT